MITGDAAGEVISVDGRRAIVRSENGEERTYVLRRFNRSNTITCVDQRFIVSKGDIVEQNQVLADSSSTEQGELALGQNVLCAFMSWDGGNYEDAILISEKMVRDDKFSSIHIESTRSRPATPSSAPKRSPATFPTWAMRRCATWTTTHHLCRRRSAPGRHPGGQDYPQGRDRADPRGKAAPRIFGEKAREVKDSSLRLPHGEEGKVVDVHVFTRDDNRDMAAGVEKMVRVSVAQRRKVTEGDKMAAVMATRALSLRLCRLRICHIWPMVRRWISS